MKERKEMVTNMKNLFNMEAEKTILHMFTVHDKEFYKHSDKIVSELFYKKVHQKIYEAICKIYRSGQKPDAILLDEELKNEYSYTEAGGIDFLDTIIDHLPASSNIDSHAKILKDKATVRKLIQMATNVIGESQNGEKEPSEIINEAERVIAGINFQKSTHTSVHAMTAAEEAFKDIMDRAELVRQGIKPDLGMRTGIKTIDDLIIGLKPSDYLILGGGSSIGKTVTVVQMLHQIAITDKNPTIFFSMEMSRKKILQRMYCFDTQINFDSIKKGTFNSHADRILSDSMVKISQSPFFINDKALTIEEIRADIRKIQNETGEKVKMVIVDHMEKVKIPSEMLSMPTVVQVTYIARELKNISNDFNCAVMVLCQFNKEVDKTMLKRPNNSHIKNASAIVEESDIIILMSRLGHHYKNIEELGGVTIFDCTKNRDGSTGEGYQFFEADIQRFRSTRKQELEDYHKGVEKIKKG